MPLSQSEREILRQRVVGYLATRSQFSFESPAIKRHLDTRGILDFAVSDADVGDALVFVEGLGFVKQQTSEMGATVYWRATSQGILASERNGWSV